MDVPFDLEKVRIMLLSKFLEVSLDAIVDLLQPLDLTVLQLDLQVHNVAFIRQLFQALDYFPRVLVDADALTRQEPRK